LLSWELHTSTCSLFMILQQLMKKKPETRCFLNSTGDTIQRTTTLRKVHIQPIHSTPAKRIKEFRQMVQAIHDKKLRLVMDVVYNHTYETTTFDRICTGILLPYRWLCRYTNGSGCGNEIATERPMVRKFIIDSVKHWVKIIISTGSGSISWGLIDIETMVQVVRELKAIDPSIIIYGEPWTGGSTSLPGEFQVTKGRQRNLSFGVFNDHFRDAVRGNNSDSLTLQELMLPAKLQYWTKSSMA
jgi:hypothetical protein